MSSVDLSWHPLEGYWICLNINRILLLLPTRITQMKVSRCTSLQPHPCGEWVLFPYSCNCFPSLTGALNFPHQWWPVMFQRKLWKKAGTKWTSSAAADKEYQIIYVQQQLSTARATGKCMKMYRVCVLTWVRQGDCISDFSIKQPWEMNFHLSTPRRLKQIVILFLQESTFG